MDRYGAAVKASDARAVASFWSDDAFHMGPGTPTQRGGAELTAYVIQAFATNRFEYSSVTVDDIDADPEMASVVGTFKGTVTPRGKSPGPFAGRYLFVLRRHADGSWKISRGMATDLPEATR
jgi:ketosteroid isomerase-like protein